MKIKTAELAGVALDWAVAKCESKNGILYDDGITRCIVVAAASGVYKGTYKPTENWNQAGPIIEREKYTISFSNSEWHKGWLAATQLPSSYIDDELGYISDCLSGATPLEAAMRLFVTRKTWRRS